MDMKRQYKEQKMLSKVTEKVVEKTNPDGTITKSIQRIFKYHHEEDDYYTEEALQALIDGYESKLNQLQTNISTMEDPYLKKRTIVTYAMGQGREMFFKKVIDTYLPEYKEVSDSIIKGLMDSIEVITDEEKKKLALEAMKEYEEEITEKDKEDVLNVIRYFDNLFTAQLPKDKETVKEYIRSINWYKEALENNHATIENESEIIL